jgi:uncharacterized membrane protein YczE
MAEEKKESNFYLYVTVGIVVLAIGVGMYLVSKVK